MSLSHSVSLINYRYDPLDRLLGVSVSGQSQDTRFYRDGRLNTQIQGCETRSFIQRDNHLLGYSRRNAHQVQSTLLGTDQQRSVLLSVTDGVRHDEVYTAHGHRQVDGGLHSLLGFNGEQPDPVTGCYLLGNGYRAYNPVLMRFHSPDTLSPFGSGGINPYAYCLGDPINMSDPTGHFSWKAILGIAITLASIAVTVISLGTSTPVTGPAAAGGISLSTAAAVIDIAAGVVSITSTIVQEVAPDSKAGEILGYVGIGLSVMKTGVSKAAERTAAAASTSLTRQGAMKVANGQALKSITNVAKLGAGARNTVVIEERLKNAGQVISLAGYGLKAYETFDEYVIPYLNAPASAPANTLDSVMRTGVEEGLQYAASEIIANFLTGEQGRNEAIRQLI
jgi:RHS repeat-associated protein